MQVTIDSTEPLERVLPVINALYRRCAHGYEHARRCRCRCRREAGTGA